MRGQNSTVQVQLHILLTCKLKSRIPTSYTKTTYRYLQLKLDLKRLQLSIDLALASEAQHPIAGDLLFGHRHHMFDLEFFVGDLKPYRMGRDVLEPG